nr:2-oxo acid dehydrogenase subunit E2 [Mycoplasmopsis bovis]
MKEVLETSAYCSLVLKADVTNLWNLRAKVKDKVFEEHNIKLTFLSLNS